MRYELRDYQRDAAMEVLKRIWRARRDWHDDDDRSSFALSAITGSGKTVIATAVIEALLFGSTDLDTDADPRISFLWITDDPALNRQTRARMFEASELLAPATLVEVDESFLDADLAPGRVFFLNTQKLSRSSRLVQSGTNAREFSFWDILRNTIRGDDDGPGPGPRRGAPRHEARRRSQDDRVAPHSRRSQGRIPRSRSCGASPPPSSASRAHGRGDGPDGLPERRGRHRARAGVGSHQGRDRSRPAGGEGDVLDDSAARGGQGHPRRSNNAGRRTRRPKGSPRCCRCSLSRYRTRRAEAKLTELVGTIDAEWPGLGPRAIAHVFGEHERLTLGSRDGRLGVPGVDPD